MSITAFAGCGGETKESTPVDTLKKYTEAVMNKDTTQMKLLLSEATLKLHTDQAKAQNVTVDEIVQRETLFPPDQRNFSYKPAVIEGNKATVDVANNYGGYDQIILVKEGGIWKIDKKGTAQQMIKTIDTDVQNLDDQMDAERKKNEELLDKMDAASPTLSPTPDPAGDPAAKEGILPVPQADVPGSAPPKQSPTQE
jgi:hypothetical protein